MQINKLSKVKLNYYNSLSNKRYQRKYGKFIIEGLCFVEEALQLQPKSDYRVDEIVVDSLFVNKPIFSRIQELTAEENIPIIAIKRYQFEQISQQSSPQGILAVLRFPAKSDDVRLGDLLTYKGIILFLDGVRDPGNCGTLIRCAAAFGASAVIIGEDTVKLYNYKVIQATAGAFFHIPIIDMGHRDSTEILSKFIERGFNIFATHTDGTNINSISIGKKNILIVGNEGAGIRKSILRLPHNKISIPISEKVDSLNAGIAGAIALYRFSSLI
ncbi:hypothetical protein DRQ33_04935 [bacterium]|nr:MAG: hypothetical protein DRQ33_04935 [bacterium]